MKGEASSAEDEVPPQSKESEVTVENGRVTFRRALLGRLALCGRLAQSVRARAPAFASGVPPPPAVTERSRADERAIVRLGGSYWNNSRNAHNSNILQVILRDHGFHKTEPPDDAWNIFWCAGQVRCCLGYMSRSGLAPTPPRSACRWTRSRCECSSHTKR